MKNHILMKNHSLLLDNKLLNIVVKRTKFDLKTSDSIWNYLKPIYGGRSTRRYIFAWLYFFIAEDKKTMNCLYEIQI